MASFAQPLHNGQVKVLVAGVGPDERRAVEATVKRALADRDPAEEWSVSLVRLGGTWSVVLNGPTERLRNVSLSTEDYRLAAAIREAIRETVDPVEPTPPPPAQPVDLPGRVRVQDHHVCGSCQKAIVVSYESDPDEPKKLAPLACPHCWKVNRVPIGAWAVEGGDYQAERA
jgi:hypothetical protein